MILSDIPSPNHSSRGNRSICGVVIHYTAGGDFQSTARWFAMESARVSAHYIVARNGDVIRCVNHDRAAWHAGRSRIFTGRFWSKAVNQRTIGIELSNYGLLHKDKSGFFWRRTGRGLAPYGGQTPVYASLNIKGAKVVTGYWEPFSELQYDSINEIFKALQADDIPTDRVWGHDEIALPVGRKIDPGAAFDWGRILRKSQRDASSHILPELDRC